MSDRVISQVAYDFVLFERSGRWILTFMIGGVFESDFSVELTSADIEQQKMNPKYIMQLLQELKHGQKLKEYIRINPSVWPE